MPDEHKLNLHGVIGEVGVPATIQKLAECIQHLGGHFRSAGHPDKAAEYEVVASGLVTLSKLAERYKVY